MMQSIDPVSCLTYRSLIDFDQILGSVYMPSQQHHVLGSIDEFNIKKESKSKPVTEETIYSVQLSVPVDLKTATKQGISTSQSRASIFEEKARNKI